MMLTGWAAPLSATWSQLELIDDTTNTLQLQQTTTITRAGKFPYEAAALSSCCSAEEKRRKSAQLISTELGGLNPALSEVYCWNQEALMKS